MRQNREKPDMDLMYDGNIWFVYISKTANKLMLYDNQKEGVIIKS